MNIFLLQDIVILIFAKYVYRWLFLQLLTIVYILYLKNFGKWFHLDVTVLLLAKQAAEPRGKRLLGVKQASLLSTFISGRKIFLIKQYFPHD